MGLLACMNKTFLIILNFIVLAVGIGVIILASVVIHRSSEYKELLLDGVLTLPIWTLIVGIIVTLIGFFGCCGAVKEHSCMLYTYASIVFILLVAEVTLGILIAIYPDKAADHVKDGMLKKLNNYHTGDDSLDISIDSLQHDSKCCGVNGPADWSYTDYKQIPVSCCKDTTAGPCVTTVPAQIYQDGCFIAIVHNLKGVTVALGITAIVLAVVQVICICIACGLAHKRREYV